MFTIKIEDSDNIKSVFYSKQNRELWVFFQSLSLYVYKIDKDKEYIIDNFIKSKEKGKYFYKFIRDKFEFSIKY